MTTLRTDRCTDLSPTNAPGTAPPRWESDGDRVIVQCPGELDYHEVSGLERLIECLIDESYGPVVLDMTHVRFLAVCGLSMLVRLSHRLRRDQRELRIAGAMSTVWQLIELAGLVGRVVQSS